ncbi:hypothetical protein QJS10_CPA16g00198 [Acorus calamus]|uniref:Lipoxygenase n=1 Tax=Acorus calamus TaxID=4465 RepID=A0AAV9CY74_ACOCL|nr:hypothetical protein QJS10_CPA16g00198 [Acorus calamus]
MLSSHQPSLKPRIHGLRSTVPIASPLAFRRQIRATQKPNLPNPVVRAVIGEDRDVVISASPSMDFDGSVAIVPSKTQSEVRLRAVITVRRKMKEKLLEKVEEEWEGFMTGIGRGILVQIVSEDVDPETKSGKRTEESPVRGWLQKPSNQPHVVEYAVDFNVSSGFGRPGAVLITNLHHKEFYLMEIVVHGFIDGPVFFPANSWIHSRNDNPKSRTIFNNRAYLSSQTPEGLKDLREEELVELRGDGKGERKKFERIYDYAPYNDLGNPDKDEDLARPVLAGEERPYPRRCRTGRPPTQTDSSSETRIEKPHPVYVPRDENFEELKQAEFSASALRALLHNLVPSLIAALSSTDGQFTCFSEIDKLYNDGVDLKLREDSFFEDLLVTKLFKKITSMSSQMMKYNIPSIISRDRFAWLRDNEFSRQALAGVNPVNIERLKEFPITSKLDPAIYGPPESAITREVLENQLNGMTIEQAIEEKRLFILDYHDMLLPFIKKMKSLKDKKAYASRTIFFFDKSEILRPLVIELSLPPTTSSPEKKYIYTHGHDATTHWTWRMAKAHVCVNDTGVHQLVNHWLRTHACMEPYIIATHRQLSGMHPIFKLLHPHMRYTMEINAVARQSLINGGGIIESCFSPGKYSLEISSAAYKSSWRFDMEPCLPTSSEGEWRWRTLLNHAASGS